MDRRTRRRGREIALQILYQTDTQGLLPVDDALRLHAEHFASPTHDDAGASDDDATLTGSEHEAARVLAERIVRGVAESAEAIDALVQRASRNWRLDRMARVDRNILRLATWELMRADDVPVKVAINEAIEIAKRFGTAESPAFVNGILDRCLDEIGRPGAPGAGPPDEKGS